MPTETPQSSEPGWLVTLSKGLCSMEAGGEGKVAGRAPRPPHPPAQPSSHCPRWKLVTVQALGTRAQASSQGGRGRRPSPRRASGSRSRLAEREDSWGQFLQPR